jgi:ankyrin repeat protein
LIFMPKESMPEPQELELASLKPLEKELSRLESLNAEEQKEPLKEFLQNNTQFLFESLPTHKELIGPVCDILVCAIPEFDPDMMGNPCDKYKIMELITPILHSIETLCIDPQKKELIGSLLTQKSKYGWNALMIAARHQPKTVAPILQSMKNYPDLLEKVLTEQQEKGWNALMIAALHQPEAVAPILQSMEKNLTLLEEVLTEQQENGWNALMLAAGRQPETVAPILQSMEKNPTILQNVLTQKDKNGCNALILAACNQPKNVAPILLSMENNRTLLEEVLTEQSADGWNALILAAGYHPDSVGSILTFAKDSAPTLRKMLSVASKKLASSEMVKLQECFLSIDFGNPPSVKPPHGNTETIKRFNEHLQVMKADLFRIGCKTSEGYMKADLFRIGCKTSEGYSHRFNAEHKLIQTLEEARNTFLTDGDTSEFIESCKGALGQAKLVLNQHRGLVGFFNEPTTSGAHLDAFLRFLETLSSETAPKQSP